MPQNTILDITPQTYAKRDILENIKKYISAPKGFYHIVSLNPENLVIAHDDPEFKEIVETAQIKLVDGVGIVVAGKTLGVPVGERVTGVQLMESLLPIANEGSLTVMLIGGKGNLAIQLAKCYIDTYVRAKFIGTKGIENIQDPKKDEEKEILAIVARTRPHLVFVALGSPFQEKWIWRNRASLQGAVCVGVGGAFDYFGGKVKRPPLLVRGMGFEWLFRLLCQPWRWKRQLRLIKFIWLVLAQRFNYV